MTIITWNVVECERETISGGITAVHWAAEAKETENGVEYQKRAIGSLEMSFDADSPGFIPYENLTEFNILAWVWDQEEGFRDNVEDTLIANIEEQKAPKTETGLPWV